MSITAYWWHAALPFCTRERSGRIKEKDLLRPFHIYGQSTIIAFFIAWDTVFLINKIQEILLPIWLLFSWITRVILHRSLSARWQWTRNKPANNANITIEIGKQISKIAWTLYTWYLLPLKHLKCAVTACRARRFLWWQPPEWSYCLTSTEWSYEWKT